MRAAGLGESAVSPEFIDVFVALSEPARRAEAASALARLCGVEEVILLVRDDAIGAMLPAPGLPQTLAGGASWRALVKDCASEGRHAARVELPAGTWRQAQCLSSGRVAIILAGGAPDEGRVAMTERLLPILAHALHAEQLARLAAAGEADARSVASHARSLAVALEASRAEHARLNARLHEEHRRKDDFLAMLAHELRNPLTPLVTTIEIMRRTAMPGFEKHLEIMERQVRQLSRLVEDLLDVSRVNRGRIELRRTRMNLADTVKDALESSGPLLEGRRHEVRLRIPDEPIHVDGDSVRLAQVFANLLHNAGKYTDPGGRIDVTVGREGAEAFVRIRDNGIGIEPRMLDDIFTLFAQVPVSLARAQGGMGIGLTLVRTLAELHGGRVAAESEGPGRGSTFTVFLPVAAARSGIRQSNAPAPVPFDGVASLRVLIVDDNEDAAESMAAILRLMGHHVEVSFSALKAIQVASDVDPDLVLLDIGMPELDGHELARRLRRILRADVRLVAVTGYGAEEDRRKSREAGFDEHAVKPVMFESITAIAARACSAKAGAQEALTDPR